MDNIIDFLINLRRIIQLYESMLKEICKDYQLTLAEATIISFLHNNPGKDTAADIVEFRRMQKSNVSAAVESLYQRGLLDRSQDQEDRRKIHLTLTASASPIVKTIDGLIKEFRGELFCGITEEELNTFFDINKKIKDNTILATERRGLK